MISQNRADAKRQVIANEQWTTVQEEDQQNRQLLDISNQILQLTRDVHAYAHAADGEKGSVARAHASDQSGHSAADAGRTSSALRKPAGSDQADH